MRAVLAVLILSLALCGVVFLWSAAAEWARRLIAKAGVTWTWFVGLLLLALAGVAYLILTGNP